jgi:hypothetical protein
LLSKCGRVNLAPMKRLLCDDEKESLRVRSRKEPTLRDNLNAVLPFYYAKTGGRGVAEQQIATELYEAIRSGIPFITYAERNPDVVDCKSGSDLLTYAVPVSRGVIMSEMIRRDRGLSVLKSRLEREGLPLSSYLAFGETIALFNAGDLGLGPDWPKILRKKLDMQRIYPECWPSGCVLNHRSPKILILDEHVLQKMRDAGADGLLPDVAGVISTNSGMTSHLAVMSRGLGIGAITCAVSDEERANAKFAFLQAGRLRLYQDMPDLSESDFVSLMAAMNRTKLTGD